MENLYKYTPQGLTDNVQAVLYPEKSFVNLFWFLQS